MSRKPQHTPESLANDAARKIAKGVDGLSFGQLDKIQSILVPCFAEARPKRNRKEVKQKTPVTA